MNILDGFGGDLLLLQARPQVAMDVIDVEREPLVGLDIEDDLLLLIRAEGDEILVGEQVGQDDVEDFVVYIRGDCGAGLRSTAGSRVSQK